MHEMAFAVAMGLMRVQKHESLTIATDFVGTVMCNVSLNMVNSRLCARDDPKPQGFCKPLAGGL